MLMDTVGTGEIILEDIENLFFNFYERYITDFANGPELEQPGDIYVFNMTYMGQVGAFNISLLNQEQQIGQSTSLILEGFRRHLMMHTDPTLEELAKEILRRENIAFI